MGLAPLLVMPLLIAQNYIQSTHPFLFAYLLMTGERTFGALAALRLTVPLPAFSLNTRQ